MRMPIRHVRSAWPTGCPSVMSSACESAAMTSDCRTSPAPPWTSSMSSPSAWQADPESPAHRRSLRFHAMPSLSALELFAVAAFALIVVPGPAVLYIVSQSVGHGRRGGLAAVFGVEIGAFVHVAGAALGVSAVIASSATAFSVLKLAGGAYLIVLGVKRLRQSDSATAGVP